MPKKRKEHVPMARDRTISIQVTGEAEINLADLVGDVPMSEVSSSAWDEADEKARAALCGCELHSIELDGLCFTIRLETT